jgi:hypothetical protein
MSKLGNLDSEIPENCDKRAPCARPQIATGVGDITYQGRPKGRCCFATAVGSVILRLPHTVNIMVDLVTGVGSIVFEFPVDGEIGLGC